VCRNATERQKKQKRHIRQKRHTDKMLSAISMKAKIKNTFKSITRALLQLKRPSAASSLKRLEEAGMSPDDFTIRDATFADIDKLIALHVQAWNETYWMVKHKATYATREYQWHEQFKITDGTWFCLVVEDKNGNLVGFAKGRHYSHSDLPAYKGELNKLYLLLPYQRLGLGKKLVCAIARRFISQGITSMVLFGAPENPSCAFHEKMGGKKLYAKNAEFHGGYGWVDLNLMVKSNYPAIRLCLVEATPL
jgi:L-amino acid N-acyltransferase YncA